MDDSEKKIWCWVGIISLLIIGIIVVVLFTTGGRANWNNHMYEVQKADDATRYSTRKKVEDTCRSMIASYTSDKLTYEQYKDSDNPERRSWADQSKIRANKTVATYNEYILKNSFVWDGNVPADINKELEYLQ